MSKRRQKKYPKPAPGYKKDGRTDLRKLPKIIYRPLKRVQAEGLAIHLQLSEASGDKPGGRLSASQHEPPTMELDPGFVGRRRLENAVHEALHLACPWMWEHVVTPIARYLTMVLWHLGLRWKDELDHE